jgi:hypothetical protein
MAKIKSSISTEGIYDSTSHPVEALKFYNLFLQYAQLGVDTGAIDYAKSRIQLLSR